MGLSEKGSRVEGWSQNLTLDRLEEESESLAEETMAAVSGGEDARSCVRDFVEIDIDFILFLSIFFKGILRGVTW